MPQYVMYYIEYDMLVLFPDILGAEVELRGDEYDDSYDKLVIHLHEHRHSHSKTTIKMLKEQAKEIIAKSFGSQSDLINV